MSEQPDYLKRVYKNLDEIVGLAERSVNEIHAYESGAGRAVQDDGLDVERLARAMADVLAGHHWKDLYPAEVAARYTALRAAPPLHDPEPDR